MGQPAYHINGGATHKAKYKLGATVAQAGIPCMMTAHNVTTFSTTDGLDAVGLSLDSGTYSTTQGDAEGLVSIDIRPDTVISMTISGGATEGTAMQAIENTSAETAGTTVTDGDVSGNDMDGGLIWCTAGANVGQSRTITTFNASTSVVVTVPFKNDIASGDSFLITPFNKHGDGAGSGSDGTGWIQLTTNLFQANAAIASGTGVEVVVVDVATNGASNSQVYFKLRDHIYEQNNVGS